MLKISQTRGRDLAVAELPDLRVRSYPLTVEVASHLAEPVAFTPDSSRILVVGAPNSGSFGPSEIDLVDLASRVVVPLGLEERIYSYAFGAAGSVGFVLPIAEKFIRLDLETLRPLAWEIGANARGLHSLEASAVFVIDYDDRGGRATFVGDADPDLFWKVKHLFDR